MYRELIHSSFRLISVATVGLLLASTSGCLIGTETETEADLGEVASPIFGGTAATKEQIFSTVALRRLGHDDDYICTGTLIAPSVVVTAAHCLVDQYPITDDIKDKYLAMEMTVIVGALDITTATEDQRYCRLQDHSASPIPGVAHGRNGRSRQIRRYRHPPLAAARHYASDVGTWNRVSAENQYGTNVGAHGSK